MITINGITFRNLEEQVAYLSENFPYFTIEGTELVIKKGDGTEIARINQAGVASINVSTSSDITTITQTFNDGTSSSFTIDMTSYLKKDTSTTIKEQAYIKNPDGTQTTKTIDDQASNGTLVSRTSTGRINSVDPLYDGNVATKKYVDDAVAGVSAITYRHFLNIVFEDGCSNTIGGIIIYESSSNTPLTSTTFKNLFNIEYTTGLDLFGRSCSQSIYNPNSVNTIYPSSFIYEPQSDAFYDALAYDNSIYDSSLTLVSITDTVSQL